MSERVRNRCFRVLILAFMIGGSLCSRSVEAQPANQDELQSGVIGWDEAKSHTGDWGEMRRYFLGRTHSTEKAFVAVAVVQPGKAAHQAHRHAEEEYLAVVEGQGQWYLDGKQFSAKKGDVLYVEPWIYHGLTNTGKEPLIFFVIKYNGQRVPPPPRPDDRPDELTPSD